MPTIDDILCQRLPDQGLNEAGVGLVKRLHASGSPVIGHDAWMFAGMMREVSADLRPLIYDYLGYVDIDSYPLIKRKGVINLDRSLSRSRRTDDAQEEESAADAPRNKGVRRRSPKTLDTNEGTTLPGGRTTRDGKPDRRCEPRTNNPNGRGKIAVPWERLEPNKWYRVPKAAAVMEIATRTVQRRVAEGEVPEDIRISGIKNLCYFIMRVAIE